MRSYQGSGLGTTICLLSHLIHHGVKELTLSDNSISSTLVKTFNISKSQIKIDYQMIFVQLLQIVYHQVLHLSPDLIYVLHEPP